MADTQAQVQQTATKVVADTQAQVQQTATKVVNETQAQVQEAANKVEAEYPHISKAAGKLILASIGAVGLARDWVDHTMDRMVARGEQSRKEVSRSVRKYRARGSQGSKSNLSKLTDTMDDVADYASKADIQSLADQISDISAKVDKLAKEKKAP